ncbi:MAG: GTP pyrophosphokinase [Clostridia bacterium]|nr:GTP pyrophosphokinase [Clostridia bacterium]
MIYTESTKRAMGICFEAHKKQVDKSVISYVFHPFHLAEQMTTEETIIVALLHDVVEDSDTTFEDLEKEGFDKSIIDAVKLLTHKDKSVKYEDYVRKIKENPIAKAVKLADLMHNSDITRLDVVTQKDLERRKKYLDAIKLLNE